MRDIFNTGIELGKVRSFLHLKEDTTGRVLRNQSMAFKSASDNLIRSRIADFKDEAEQLKRLSYLKVQLHLNDEHQIMDILKRIQQKGGGEYQAVSAGFWLGRAIAGCENIKLYSDDLSIAKSELSSWLNGALAHLDALKAQGFKPRMPSFKSSTSMILRKIDDTTSLIYLKSIVSDLKSLSGKVGAAIR